MTELKLRYSIGIMILLLHLGLFAIIAILFIEGGLSFEQFTTAIAIILPLFAGYATAVVTFIIRDRFRKVDDSNQVTAVFSLLSFVYPLAFFGLLAGAVCLQANGKVFANFEQFKATVTLIDGAFAVYVSSFVYSLFEKIQTHAQ